MPCRHGQHRCDKSPRRRQLFPLRDHHDKASKDRWLTRHNDVLRHHWRDNISLMQCLTKEAPGPSKSMWCRPSRYRDESPPRRRRSPSTRDYRDRASDDRHRGGRGADVRDSRRYDDSRRRGSPDGRRADRDDYRRSGRSEQNGRRELPPPPPFSGDKDRSVLS